MQKAKCTAIVLAAGQGKRMGTKIQKQYLDIAGKPVLYYSLRAFERSKIIDEVVLVAGAGQTDYCEKEIVSKYGFQKVKAIVEGGAERYHSVMNGLRCVKGGYVFIHDGARPFVTEDILERVYQEVLQEKACVVGVPVKDTIKMADENGFVDRTPDRSRLWQVQTPQVFETELIRNAYEKLMEQSEVIVTDDAMVVEQMSGNKVKLVTGSYNNIKITTSEDLLMAEKIAKNILDESL